MAPNHLALKKEFVTWLPARWNLEGMAIAREGTRRKLVSCPAHPTPLEILCSVSLTPHFPVPPFLQAPGAEVARANGRRGLLRTRASQLLATSFVPLQTSGLLNYD